MICDRMRRPAIALTVLVSTSCGGGGGPAPTTPTKAAPPSNAWSATGHITTLDTGGPVAGATITPGWSLGPVTTDADGTYQLADTNAPAAPYPLTVSGDAIVTHDVWINWMRGARTGVDISVIHDAAPFSMDYYRQLVRGAYDHTDGRF